LNYKPSKRVKIPAIGSRCRTSERALKKIRVHMEGEYRVLYVAKFQSCVYVLHAFVKKRRKTSPAAIAVARSRYKEVLRREAQRE
jgi:phage-related protein